MSEEEIDIVVGWKNAVRGTFVVDRHLRKGSVLVSADKKVYLVKGILYRYWHYYTKEDSVKIYKQASVATMKRNYLMFHTMAPELAIGDLKEISRQKK